MVVTHDSYCQEQHLIETIVDDTHIMVVTHDSYCQEQRSEITV